METEMSNSFRYTRLLARCAEGRCLWYPTEIGRVGDVGFVFEGYFNKLFNVFEAPEPLPSLPAAPGITSVIIRNNTHGAWMSVEGGAHRVAAGNQATTGDVSLGFEFSSARASGAFLVPGGRTRRVARYLKETILANYLLEHYSLILNTYSHRPLEECPLMILKGTTRVSAWCRGLTTQTARGIAGHISINVPDIGIPVLSLDINHHRTALQHWLIESGPAEDLEEDSTTPTDCCIIIQPVVVRLSDRIKYRMKAILATRIQQTPGWVGPAPPPHPEYLPFLKSSQSGGDIAVPVMVQNPLAREKQLLESGSPIIAIFGQSGAGKSTFVNLVALETQKVGRDLQSCTRNVNIVEAKVGEQRVVVIDTPGIDNTGVGMKESDVLLDIAYRLTTMGEHRVWVTGVLFLHPISDNKFSHTTKRISTMLKNLCGDAAMDRLMLCTTMWDRVPEAEGYKRFNELCETGAWKEMILGGASTATLSNTSFNAKAEAEKIVTQLIKNVQPVEVAIQDELVKKPAETSAGQVLDAHLREMQADGERESKETRDRLREENEINAAKAKAEIRAPDEEFADLQASIFIAALLAALQSTARIRGADNGSGHLAS